MQGLVEPSLDDGGSSGDQSQPLILGGVGPTREDIVETSFDDAASHGHGDDILAVMNKGETDIITCKSICACQI